MSKLEESNICYGDGYFAKSIEDKFSKEEIKQAKKKLKIFKKPRKNA